MSVASRSAHSSRVHPSRTHHSAHERSHQPRRAADGTGSRSNGYTLAHAGRQVRIGPVAFWIVVGTLVIMAIWSAATGTYFAFKDDLLTRLISRQAHMQYAYEDRITELRMQVDRLTSRQLIDQEQFEQKLETLVKRQAALEQRTSAMSGLPDVAVTGSVKAVRTDAKVEGALGAVKPLPLNDNATRPRPLDRGAKLNGWSLQSAPKEAARSTAAIEAALAEIQLSLDAVASKQTTKLKLVEESYEARAKRVRSVLTELGVDLGKDASPAAKSVGGPYIPANVRNDGQVFELQVQRIGLARAQMERLVRTLGGVPVRAPVEGELETTSNFGVRLDPFLRSPAMHSGLDFRGASGDPVNATGAGKVASAGWNGGYGRVVEIDHGNGFSTRYGHLSSIEVKEGQTVRAGQLIGRIGSTGRSTGPHLHYETRVDGEAVDPQKFLRAGVALSGLDLR